MAPLLLAAWRLLARTHRDGVVCVAQDCVATHDRVMLKAVSCWHLSEVAHLVSEFTVIGIDEGQFFEDVRFQGCVACGALVTHVVVSWHAANPVL